MKANSRWMVHPTPITAPCLRLLCFPHAGGNASIFKNWANELPKCIEVCGIQYPGRGGRIFEPPPVSIDSIVEGLTLQEIYPDCQKTPVALFRTQLGSVSSL